VAKYLHCLQPIGDPNGERETPNEKQNRDICLKKKNPAKIFGRTSMAFRIDTIVREVRWEDWESTLEARRAATISTYFIEVMRDSR
jgi:hypothetical protein